MNETSRHDAWNACEGYVRKKGKYLIIGQAELMGAVAMLDETVGRQTFSF